LLALENGGKIELKNDLKIWKCKFDKIRWNSMNILLIGLEAKS
jgi:hypothetical protein